MRGAITVNDLTRSEGPDRAVLQLWRLDLISGLLRGRLKRPANFNFTESAIGFTPAVRKLE
jgi:hypothetical protein